ncbi:MAG: DUF1232 domain-containing protein [Candidatus Glassbacteria bacterium]
MAFDADSRERKFYDSLKSRIMDWIGRKLGARIEGLACFAFLLPDILMLLGRILVDRRAPRRLRIKLGIVIAYLASPLDLIPEGVLGPLGLVDDLVLAAFALNRVFAEVEDEIIEEHWSGEKRHLEKLHDLADLADGIFSGRVGGKLQDWYDRDPALEVGPEDQRMELVTEENGAEDRIERLRASGL